MATYLAKTFGSAGNQRTWTWSGWVKFTGGGADETIFSGGIGLGVSGNRVVFQTLSGEAEKVMAFSGNTSEFAFKTSASLRDKSAWYHFVLAMDTTQATASNRFKMYINGSQVTDTAQLTYPSQNLELGMNNNEQQYIGLKTSDNNNAFNGYMADVYFIDGTQLTATSFGETDSTTGIWKPKTYSGSYGTNGYRLEFKNSGALGTDTSGNSNTWTVNNAGTGAQVVDTPSNVFSTFNPLIERPLEGPATFAQGALQASGTSKMAFSSIALPSSGKWYAEFKATAGTSTAYVGLRDVDDFTVDGNSNRLFYRNDGQKDTGSGESSYGNSWTTNDIISIAANVDDSEVTFYKNGTAQDGGTAISQNCANQYFFVATGGGWSFQANFGNPSFSISSGNADANGYGNFEYAVPSGYYALCTENLNTYG
jgi:hypothetical protein